MALIDILAGTLATSIFPVLVRDITTVCLRLAFVRGLPKRAEPGAITRALVGLFTLLVGICNISMIVLYSGDDCAWIAAVVY